MNTKLHWYLIHCKAHEEQRALAHLQRQGFECYLPMVSVEKRSKGGKFEVSAPLFPRYLFIRLGKTEDNWYPIRSTRGVSGLVCFDGRPTPIHDEIIDGIRARLAAEPLMTPYLRSGERVEIVQGAFSSLEAIFLAYDDKQRVVLLLEILQTQQRLHFPLPAVRKLG